MNSKSELEDYYEIHLDSDRIAKLYLPSPLTYADKEKLKQYIELSISFVCVDDFVPTELEPPQV